MIHQLKLGDRLWNVVRKVKANTSIDLNCNRDGLYSIALSDQVAAVEKELGVEAYTQLLKNITFAELKAAAEMYLYLNTCPRTDELKFWFKEWIKFFEELFKTSPQHIILTLNRLINNDSAQNMEVKRMAEQLFKRITSLFSINFEDLQNLLHGNEITEVASKNMNFAGIYLHSTNTC